MATDYQRIVKNLLDFVDLAGRTVIVVGAGGGQLIEYARPVAKIIAVDQDPAALAVLREKSELAGLADKFRFVQDDFLRFSGKGDIVLFEFCLHEMPDPRVALAHARPLAPILVVMDHWPGSPWTFFTGEEDQVAEAWAEVMASGPEKTVSFEDVQAFKEFEELRKKVLVQGEKALARIEQFRGSSNISIPMSYGFALLGGGPHL